MLSETIDDEHVRVCVLRIPITRDKILSFLSITCEYSISNKNSRHT
jgi:hypothetical protein